MADDFIFETKAVELFSNKSQFCKKLSAWNSSHCVQKRLVGQVECGVRIECAQFAYNETFRGGMCERASALMKMTRNNFCSSSFVINRLLKAARRSRDRSLACTFVCSLVRQKEANEFSLSRRN
jgi:hypothetical protein